MEFRVHLGCILIQFSLQNALKHQDNTKYLGGTQVPNPPLCFETTSWDMSKVQREKVGFGPDWHPTTCSWVWFDPSTWVTEVVGSRFDPSTWFSSYLGSWVWFDPSTWVIFQGKLPYKAIFSCGAIQCIFKVILPCIEPEKNRLRGYTGYLNSDLQGGNSPPQAKILGNKRCITVQK